MAELIIPSEQFSRAAQAVVDCIRQYFGEGTIALHEPRFDQCDVAAVAGVVQSGFVSSVGDQVVAFEESLADFTGAKHVVAVMNGTAALHAALLACGIRAGDEVITQALTFVATCNAIRYCQAEPVFVDVDRDTMGLSPTALRQWLTENTQVVQGECINNMTGRRVWACVPMHTFGHPVRIDEIADICAEFCLLLIEDAAEGLGSYYRDQHIGRKGHCATLSFNGNKVITTGGGGAVMTDDDDLARRLKHLTTTAKAANGWASYHDELGYNYRLPNLNAALGIAQMQHLRKFLSDKAGLANYYQAFFSGHAWTFVLPITGSQPNHWLNVVMLPDASHRDSFIQYCADRQIHVRPTWTPMDQLPMFSNCQHDELSNTRWFADCLVNLPSSAKPLA